MKYIFIIVLLLSNLLVASSENKLINIIESNTTYEVEAVDDSNLGVPKVRLENNNSQVMLRTESELSTVIYILIDSSIPMNQAYKKGIKPFLKVTVPTLETHDMQVIISTFDKDIRHIYDSSKNIKLNKALKKIKINGKTTELWRNVSIVLNELKSMEKRRKILIVMSDGDAEDTQAYTLNDVVTLAKKSNIRISSIAYRDKTVVQNLRKIAEETNGKVWIANKHTHKVNKFFMKELAHFITSHFLFYIPADIIKPSLTGEQIMTISFEHNNSISTLPIKLRVDTLQQPLTFWEKYKLYILIVLALLLLLLLFFLLKPKKEVMEETLEEATIIPEPFIPVPEPIAFFESMGGTKHEIFKFPSTIGKNIGNDVVIEGQYISRSHALIDLKDGIFYITDTDSVNGTEVNGAVVKGTVEIRPNDKVDFGPYKTVFVLV